MGRKKTCPECGGKMDSDGITYTCQDCGSQFIVGYTSPKEDIPEGCAACGGPYPDCTSSCPIFDD